MKMTHVRRICWGGLAAGMLLVSGCHSICRKNVAAGQPLIVCQPMDMATPEEETAILKVKLKDEAKCDFEWHRVLYTGKGVVEESLADKEGGKTSKLKLSYVTKADQGSYFCEIIHHAGHGRGAVPSRTRLAWLEVGPKKLAPMSQGVTVSNLLTVVQYATKTLTSTSPGGNAKCDLSTYKLSITFPVTGAAKLHSPPGSSGTCQLHLDQTLSGSSTTTAYPNSNWAATWETSSSNPVCIPNKVGVNDRSFAVTKFDKDHTFVVYLGPVQAIGTTYKLTVTWTVSP